MRFALLMSAAAAIAATSASAATVDVRNTYPVANQGFASPLNAIAGSGLIEERFNSNRALGTCSLRYGYTFRYGVSAQPSTLSSFNGDVSQLGLASTTLPGQALQPAGDTSCYVFGPQSTHGGRILDHYPIFIQPRVTGGNQITATYLGFYLGSIDEYNYFQLGSDTNGDGTSPIVIPGLGDQTTGIFTGAQLAAYLGVALYSNNYIEFFMAPTERLRYIVVGSNNRSVEMDNLAVSFSPVTAPKVVK